MYNLFEWFSPDACAPESASWSAQGGAYCAGDASAGAEADGWLDYHHISSIRSLEITTTKLLLKFDYYYCYYYYYYYY